MKSPLAFLMLICVLIFSGCTLPGTSSGDTVVGTGTDGLVVEYVQADQNYVQSGDTIQIEARATNYGDKNIEHVTAMPLYLPWPGFTGSQDCYDVGKPNEELGRVGGPCTVYWSGVDVPEVSKQEEFTVGVRFYYDYSTSASIRVFALTADRYAGYLERGETPPMVYNIVPSEGPIQIEAQLDKVIIIPESGERRVPVILNFVNQGTGYPQGSGDNARRYSLDSVEIDTEYTGGMYVDWEDGGCDQEITMSGGSSGDCVFYLIVSDIGDSYDEIYADIKVTVDYSYVVEGQSTIVVSPNIADDLV